MGDQTLPLIVLAGSDRAPATLPERGVGKRPLCGTKGIRIKIGGRPLIDVLIERLRACGGFDPVFIAGPAAVYGKRHNGVAVIDTNSSFGKNIEVALAAVEAQFPDQAVALTTCDILPRVEELRHLLADYRQHSRRYFWFSLIRVPEEPERLGASEWKPRYGVVTEPGQPPVPTLPGHLVVVYPRACRRPLIYRCFDTAYRSRNRPPMFRFWFILVHGVYHLLAEDLRRLRRLRPPTFWLTVIWNGIAIARSLRAGNMIPEVSAKRISRILIRDEYHKRSPDRVGRLVVLDGLSMAKDIDTEEEAKETGLEVD